MNDNMETQEGEFVSPIDSLRQILSGAGEDIEKIFGPAVSTYAGPFSAGQTPKEKYSALERIIVEYKSPKQG